MSKHTKTEVLYNADCPVCSKEIDHYARITKRDVLPIRYDNLNAADVSKAWGIDPDAAARRLHVRKGDQILSGVPAFIALWQEIPQYRWLARVTATPGIQGLAVLVYDWILAPALYASHKRRIKRQKL